MKIWSEASSCLTSEGAHQKIPSHEKAGFEISQNETQLEWVGHVRKQRGGQYRMHLWIIYDMSVCFGVLPDST